MLSAHILALFGCCFTISNDFLWKSTSAKSRNLGWKQRKFQQNWRSFRYPGTANTLDSWSMFLRLSFLFIGNIRQFISNSNSSNTKYFYDWPISNSSNTPISNYFLTVWTKKEFTVYGNVVHMVWTLCHEVKVSVTYISQSSDFV